MTVRAWQLVLSLLAIACGWGDVRADGRAPAGGPQVGALVPEAARADLLRGLLDVPVADLEASLSGGDPPDLEPADLAARAAPWQRLAHWLAPSRRPASGGARRPPSAPRARAPPIG